MANWITAISTLLMMIATFALVIIAWQAKNSFLAERKFDNLILLHEELILTVGIIIKNSMLKTNEEKTILFENELSSKLKTINSYYIKVAPLVGKSAKKYIDNIRNDIIEVVHFYCNKKPAEELSEFQQKFIEQLIKYVNNDRLFEIIKLELKIKEK